MPGYLLWWALGAVVLVVVLGAAWGLARRGERRHTRHRLPTRPRHAPDAPRPRAAVIVNPTKFEDPQAVRDRVRAVCAQLGWADPIWQETTIADPGTGQAERAAQAGAEVVCALGGDGTVRAVARGLVGTTTPLGLLPGGTGNLLARNLDVPVDSVEHALAVALTGRERLVDVGRVLVDRSGEDHAPRPEMFLVMAGMGFDAAVMANAPEHLKAQMGTGAYVVSGLQNMLGPQFKVRVRVDDQPEFTRRTKTVLIGNCGRLFGGVALIPSAAVDDGILDTVLLSPKGVVGWAAVATHVITRRSRGHRLIDYVSGERVALHADRPEQVQLDGDTLGQARALTAWVDRRALRVRVPAQSS
ncbi:MAG: diacylglycerol kinase family protein [Dermatophilaceae bacterium]